MKVKSNRAVRMTRLKDIKQLISPTVEECDDGFLYKCRTTKTNGADIVFPFDWPYLINEHNHVLSPLFDYEVTAVLNTLGITVSRVSALLCRASQTSNVIRAVADYSPYANALLFGEWLLNDKGEQSVFSERGLTQCKTIIGHHTQTLTMLPLGYDPDHPEQLTPTARGIELAEERYNLYGDFLKNYGVYLPDRSAVVAWEKLAVKRGAEVR